MHSRRLLAGPFIDPRLVHQYVPSSNPLQAPSEVPSNSDQQSGGNKAEVVELDQFRWLLVIEGLGSDVIPAQDWVFGIPGSRKPGGFSPDSRS